MMAIVPGFSRSTHERINEPSLHGSNPQPEYAIAFLENLTSAVDSGNLFAQRKLTVADVRFRPKAALVRSGTRIPIVSELTEWLLLSAPNVAAFP